MFFKTEVLLLFYLLHYLNPPTNLSLLQEKGQRSVYSSTSVFEGLMNTNAEET